MASPLRSGSTPSLKNAMFEFEDEGEDYSNRNQLFIRDAQGQLVVPPLVTPEGEVLPEQTLDDLLQPPEANLISVPRPPETSPIGMTTAMIGTPGTLQPGEGSGSKDVFKDTQDSLTPPGASEGLPLVIPPIRSGLPSSYPNPYTVLVDHAAASELVNSGVLENLSAVRSQTVLASGEQTITTSITSFKLTAYYQLCLAVASRHYSTLPDAGFDEETFQLLFFYKFLDKLRSQPIPQAVRKAADALKAAYHRDIQHLLDVVSHALVHDKAIEETGVTEFPNVHLHNSLLTEITQLCPLVVHAYKILYYLVHVGSKGIDPVPDLVRYNENLQDYIDSIAVGTGRIQQSDVVIQPRLAELVVLPAKNVSAAPVPSALPTIPQTTTASSRPGVQYGLVRKNKQQQTLGGNQTNLLSQGEPGRNTIVRDTVAFRDSVEIDTRVLTGIQDIMTEVRGLSAQMSLLNERVNLLSESFAQMNSAYATSIARSNASDLAERINVNRTLFPTPQAPGVTMPSTSTPMQSSPQTLQAAINALRLLSPGTYDQAVFDRLKSALMANGHNNVANSLNRAMFENATARRRLIARLQSLG